MIARAHDCGEPILVVWYLPPIETVPPLVVRIRLELCPRCRLWWPTCPLTPKDEARANEQVNTEMPGEWRMLR